MLSPATGRNEASLRPVAGDSFHRQYTSSNDDDAILSRYATLRHTGTFIKGNALNFKVQDLEKYISWVVFIPPTISQFGKIISTNLSYVCF
jgi:hypothetical protein